MWLVVRPTSLLSWGMISGQLILKLSSYWRHLPRQTPAPLSLSLSLSLKKSGISTRTLQLKSLHSSNFFKKIKSIKFQNPLKKPPFSLTPRAMYTHPNTAFTRAADFLGHPATSPDNLTPLDLPTLTLPLPLPLLPPNLLDQLASPTSEFDSVMNSPEIGNNNSSNCSGCSSYGSTSSFASHQTQRPTFFQRSVSSNSFQKSGFRQLVSSSTHEFVDSESGPVRRVFSTGDLQVRILLKCPLCFSRNDMSFNSVSQGRLRRIWIHLFGWN